ncbi:alpha-galactosidase 1 [Jimgerdemannia flammicorona]|uniref:Alpha-galactosidase n=1 Tax=Jimgerdemannia flammicorona TaxID=994334 RepID=A0A433QHW7_9FUNG|nr:alpha-galactosidase 1 [Jimgerdemannia flammicorona]
MRGRRSKVAKAVMEYGWWRRVSSRHTRSLDQILPVVTVTSLSQCQPHLADGKLKFGNPHRLGRPVIFASPTGTRQRSRSNPCNGFACNINEDLVKETADYMISTGRVHARIFRQGELSNGGANCVIPNGPGLAAAGYNYVNLDDCWQNRRNVRGIIEADKKRFPSGIKALADYVHSKGLLIGIYSDAGIMTCQRRPGSLGFEIQDAKTYAGWGIDYLKYDNCYNLRLKAPPRYKAMRDALNATGRPILYSVCNWGEEDPWLWGPEYANSWRTTDAFSASSISAEKPCVQCSVLDILDRQIAITQYAAPGAFNDPDMLEIGNGGMTYEEYKTHFTFWAALKSPLVIMISVKSSGYLVTPLSMLNSQIIVHPNSLIVGCDVRNMTADVIEILTAPEVIAVNQDPLGKSIRLVKKNVNVGTELWVGPLQGGDLVAVLLNRGESAQPMTISWASDLSMTDVTKLVVRDLWSRKDLGHFDQKYVATDIPPHGIVMLRFSKQAEL